jgi:hypothetical protein
MLRGEAISNGFTKSLGAGTYTISGSTSKVSLEAISDSGTLLATSNNGNSASFTFSATTTVIVRCAATTGQALGTSTIIYPQLQAGSRATTYVPYTTYAYELAKIGTYQDYIWNDGGTWKIHKEVGKVVFDGSEDEGWWLQSGTTNEMRAPFSGSFSGAPLLSNYFHDGTSLSEIGTMRIYTNGYIRAISNQTSANDFKTWLSTHNTTVYYALATPTDTEITDSELIEQLNHIYSLYGGQNNLWLIPSGGAQGEFTGDYVVYDKYNKHQVYIWSSDDNTWQIILP